MPLPAGRFLVDAHQDIACHCQEMGRDLAYPFRPGGGPPNPDGSPGVARVPCMITLPGLHAAQARLVCATLFSPHTYPTGGKVPEGERRWKLNAQWQMYQDWLAEYPDDLIWVRSRTDLDTLAASPGAIGLLLLMEGLELLESPAELQTWFERGVRMAGLTWNGTTRYASGCFADGKPLTPLGLKLLAEFERLEMILDLAHLNDAGIADVFAYYAGPLCSTHSNSRAICAHERNLTDAQAQEIARRDGVIGLNLLAHFVQPGYRTGDAQPALDMALQHVEHFAALCGPTHIGLGSDLDGGLTPDNTPYGIECVEDLPKLGERLAARGWSAAHVRGFEGANWWAFFERCLPSTSPG